MKVAISSGHGKYIRGASGKSCGSWGLDEVDEARRVVDQLANDLRSVGVTVYGPFNDDISTSQSENLNRITNWHNNQPAHDLDVSVHFNAYQCTTNPMGTETLYVTQQSLAAKVAAAIATTSGLINRGAKKRTDLAFLNNTRAPAILEEVCFVDSRADADIYRAQFSNICSAFAQALSGQEVQPQPPEPPQPGEPPVPPAGTRPTISKGSFGPNVVYAQQQLNSDYNAGLDVDGDFGSRTDSATRGFQASRALAADGIIGPQTWDALENDKPPYVPPGLPPVLSDADIENITQIAMNSPIARYNWRDRGMAPPGYTKGFALSFANVYRKLKVGHAPSIEMAKAKTTNSKDVLVVYAAEFAALGMDNNTAGADTLRHLYALQLGLGMRESSGRHCEGRDMSASNVTSDTAEAGLYQTSYNARSCSPTFGQEFNEYGPATGNPQGFLNVFAEGVYCNASSWQNYGSGDGAKFQRMCKEQPAFAVETCAIVLRNLCNHYGPINRKEAQLRQDAADMLMAVQNYIDAQAAIA